MEQQKKTKQDLEQDMVDVVYGFVGLLKTLFWVFVFCVVVGGITVYNALPPQ